MALFGLGTRSQQPNRLGSIQVGTSEYGVAVPIGWGDFKTPIKVIDYTDFSSVPITQGGSGGGQFGSYEYYAAVDALICQGPIAGLGNIFDTGGGGLLLHATDTFTIGALTHQVQQGVAAFYYDEGVTYPVNYSLTANDFGSDGSVTLSGTQPVPMERIGVLGMTLPPPGPQQYTVSPTGLYTFNAADIGKTVTILYVYTTADTSNGAITTTNNPRSPILRYTLGLALGTTPQTPWDYMLTAHPDRALRYDGLAHLFCQNMDLGSGAVVPNLNVEVLNGRLKSFGRGIGDCDPAAILTDALEDAVAGCNWPHLGDLTNYSNFCVANNLFMSFGLDSVRKMTEIIQEICDLTNAAPVWSGSVLKIRPYGDTSAVGNGRTYTPDTEPIYEIDEDEMLCAAGAEAVKLGRQNLADNFNRIQFEYTSRNDNYNTALIHEQDSASIQRNGLLPMKTVSAHQYCVQLYAAIAMGMMLRRHSTPLRTFEFTLPWYFQLLEPMDILLVNLTVGGLGQRAIRIVSVEEQEDYSLKIEAEDFLFGVAQGVVFPKGLTAGNAPGAHDNPGDTTLLSAFLPGPRVTGGDSELWLALTGGASWGGCDIFLSLDNTTYTKIGTQYGKARAGTLTATLGANADPDTTHTAAVTVSGSLATVSLVEADAFATLSLLGTELIAYETATITGSTADTNSYGLTYLRRGVFSTGVQAHAAGERFIRLDTSIFKYVLDPSLAGKTVYLKFTSFNLYGQEEQTLPNVAAYPVTLGAGPSSNMTVSSSVNSGGTDATVSVNLTGGSPTASGSATLPNGATVVLPPHSWPSEALSTWYGVNYDPAGTAYVLYTDPNVWLAAQSTMIAIGSTTTPAYVSGGSIYRPSSYTDTGTYGTTAPTAAYDGNSGTNASVRGYFSTSGMGGGLGSNGDCTWAGFAPVTTAAAKTLTVEGSISDTSSAAIPFGIVVTIAGVTTLLSGSDVAGAGPYTVSIPSGTLLSGVSVNAYAQGASSGDADSVDPLTEHVIITVNEIYIQ